MTAGPPGNSRTTNSCGGHATLTDAYARTATPPSMAPAACAFLRDLSEAGQRRPGSAPVACPVASTTYAQLELPGQPAQRGLSVASKWPPLAPSCWLSPNAPAGFTRLPASPWGTHISWDHPRGGRGHGRLPRASIS
ncbi:hypothetical protein NDU88_004707 [Pleurodeles waltl]|uniref:Uncharacterized protein n=1 Tax=Pleurodeles waltl TaxID=8319 RepID=A0AAV7VJ08_PLEWA|nr:hypothetical protein NDU88_004707 [Pleurodeles waltl]